MKTSAGNLLPFNTPGLPNAGGTSPTLFLAGDVRANENVMLTSLHTLFVREHNRLAALIQLLAPEATDEEIYQLARKIVGAEMQLITYGEFLPALLGPAAPPVNVLNYDSSVDPSIANEFSTAFYRFGHSLLSPQLVMSGESGRTELLPLRNAFFQPSLLVDDPEDVDRLLIGASLQVCQDVDNRVVDDVRNFLFGPPGAGGLDLATLNIQRGRDHGLPDYNTLRQAYGLSSASGFGNVSSDAGIQEALEDLYDSTNDIDAWVGGLAENHLPGSSVGELLSVALSEQFARLLAGDRLSILNDPDLQDEIVKAGVHLEELTLANIIRANTTARLLPEDIFSVDGASDSDVVATYDEDTNRIHITGNASNNVISLWEVPFGFIVMGHSGTTVNGSVITMLITDNRPHLTTDLGAGADRFTLISCRFRDCVIQMRGGDDVLRGFTSRSQRSAIDGGNGNDSYNNGIRTPRPFTRLHNLP